MSDKQKDTVFIEVEGGVIQNVTATNPDIDVVVVDTDIEGLAPEDIKVISWNDREVEAAVSRPARGERDQDWEAAVLGAIGARATDKAE